MHRTNHAMLKTQNGAFMFFASEFKMGNGFLVISLALSTRLLCKRNKVDDDGEVNEGLHHHSWLAGRAGKMSPALKDGVAGCVLTFSALLCARQGWKGNMGRARKAWLGGEDSAPLARAAAVGAWDCLAGRVRAGKERGVLSPKVSRRAWWLMLWVNLTESQGALISGWTLLVSTSVRRLPN